MLQSSRSTTLLHIDSSVLVARSVSQEPRERAIAAAHAQLADLIRRAA